MDYNCSDYDSSSMYSDESGLELSSQPQVKFRQRNPRSTEQSTSYRFSMANLEESHEAELDAILSELSLLEQHAKSKQINNSDKMASNNTQTNHNNIIPSQTLTNEHNGRADLRLNSRISSTTNSTISISSSSDICSNVGSTTETSVAMRESRTDSPDNDSAFSDTVSLLSSESSTSSGICSSTGIMPHTKSIHSNLIQGDSAKNAKIQLALQKLEQASIRRLFVKAFTIDGASKSLLVDENMSCGHVTRLLADKNHVQMEPRWALVEHLPELQMERLFEDHEMLVDSLMDWNNDQKNRVLFSQRSDKVALFNCPEKFLNSPQMASGNDYDEHSRSLLLDEHFSSGNQIALEGPLYVKIDSKKVWKRYHFVLRASGIYYYPKEKTKSPRDLLCHSLFAGHNVYKGFGWKKKHKAPTEYTFALKPEKEPTNGSKSQRSIKMLCAEDMESLEKWVTAIRVAKYGKDLLVNHRALVNNLAREEMDKFSSNRCNSIGSIISSVPSQCSNDSAINSLEKNNNSNGSNTNSNGRMSRSSSSSSSGCLSDADNAFDSDFPTGTIKRKPSMKPNLPLTSMTRQLKEVGENTYGSESSNPASPERGGTLTRRHSCRRSEDGSCGSNNSTLKRRPSNKVACSIESMALSTTTPSSPCTPIATHSGINNNSVDALPISPLEVMPSCMTDSMFSLPPPPDDENTLTGSTFSLDSLPAPPSANELNEFLGDQPINCPLPTEPVYYISDRNIKNNNNNNNINNSNTNNSINLVSNNNALPLPNFASEMDECDQAVIVAPLHESNTVMSQPIYVSSMKSSIKAPPYKSPPAYNTDMNEMIATNATQPQPKTVKFADSPVLLRRKVCFEDEVFNNQQHHQSMPLSPRRTSLKLDSIPMPPPRSERTRLSSTSSPKRLTESMSNPPSEFLHDLQRVMRKKWQIAQKFQSEPATATVLGFRDFDDNGQQIDYHDSAHFYRESSNVSNWVQEHYGTVVVDNLYENLGIDANDKCPLPKPIIKKRPPPPIPKRDSKTVLTQRT